MKTVVFTRVSAILLLALLVVPLQLRAQTFAGGSGTQSNPYLIRTAAQLELLATYVNDDYGDYSGKYYKLDADIDLSAYGAGYNGGMGWTPIGHDNSGVFKGHFDGNGKTISNLYINNMMPGYHSTGLFGWVRNGSVKNLKVTGATVRGGYFTGGIAGYASDNSVEYHIIISNCSFSGTVEGMGEIVGGIAGGIDGGGVSGCSVAGMITGWDYVGGVTGWSANGSLTNSYTTCTVYGWDHVGGLAGWCENGAITNCYSTGNVAGGSIVGGVAGGNEDANITNSYAIGAVDGSSMTGGITGGCYQGAVINCAALNLSVKATTSTTNIGRVAGFNSGTLTNNIALSSMIVTANNINKQITNDPSGLDGASRSSARLQTADGYPSVFTVSPWVYAPGFLPGLDGVVNMPPHVISEYTVNLIIRKNNANWPDHGKTFTLKYSADESITRTLTNSGNIASGTVDRLNEWRVYEGNTYTGWNIIVAGNEITNTQLNYYSVNFSVIDAGDARGSSIRATYGENDTEIKSGDIVPGGKRLDLRATGAGASTYTYQWSGAGTNNATSRTLSIWELSGTVNAICTVTGVAAYPVHFNTVNGNGAVTASVNDTPITDGQQVARRATVVFTATPNTNLGVKEWKDNTATVNGKNLVYTIANLSEAHTVTVEFEPVGYTVTFGVTGGNGALAATRVDGIISDNTSGAVNIMRNGSVTFTARPNAGYHVAEWRVDGALQPNTGNTLTLDNVTEETAVTVSYEKSKYTVHFRHGDNGSLTATVDGLPITSGVQLEYGKTVVFTASPNTNYKVGEWKNGASEIYDAGIIWSPVVTENLNITVSFTLVTYKVTFSSDGGGSLTATADGKPITTNAEVKHGSTVVFTAIPAANNRVKGWNPANQPDALAPTHTITNITSDRTVSVEFEPIAYAVRFSVTGGNGTLAATVDGAPISTGAAVQQGKTVVFTTSPNTNYTVKEWFDDGVKINGAQQGYTIANIMEEHNITVSFEDSNIAQYDVVYSAGTGGSITAMVDGAVISSGAKVKRGRIVTFIASPNSGQRVSLWQIDGANEIGNTTNIYTLNNLTANVNIQVSFNSGTPTYAVIFNVDGGNGGITANADGTNLTPTASVTSGSTVNFTATPVTGYRVNEWKLNGSSLGRKNMNTYTISALSATSIVSVSFERDLYAVSYSAGVNGSISATVGGGGISTGQQVFNGSDVVFTASPNEGYQVKEWTVTGGAQVSVSTDKRIYTMKVASLDATVSVTFEKIPYTIQYSVVGYFGSISAAVNGGVVYSSGTAYHGDDVIFTATPDRHYRVKAWKLNGNEIFGQTGSIYTLANLNANATVTVEFEYSSHVVTFSTKDDLGLLLARIVGGSAIRSGDEVISGVNIEFTATIPYCHTIAEWKVNGKTVVGHTGNIFTLVDIVEASDVTVTFAPNLYPMTYSVVNNTGGSITTTGIENGMAAHGSRTTSFIAVPNEGYQVKAWTDNGHIVNGQNNSYTISLVTGAHTVTVEYEVKRYKVIFEAVTDNGSITATDNGAPISSGAEVLHGHTVRFTAEPKPTFVVKNWEDNGAEVNGKETEYMISSISAAHTVAVAFEPTNHPVTFKVVNGNGSITASINGLVEIASGSPVIHGRRIVFTASPNSGYFVKEWTQNGKVITGVTTASYTLPELTEEVTITVEFQQHSPTIITTTLPFGVTGIGYRYTLMVAHPPVAWKVVAGKLPDGLTLSTDGVLSGTPAQPGIYNFTVEASNNAGAATQTLICTIVKAIGTSVSTPTLRSKTSTSITINPVMEPANGQKVEYAISKIENAFVNTLMWISGLTFSGLSENTTYYVYARSKENENYLAGNVSISEPITTYAAGVTYSGDDVTTIPLTAYINGKNLHVCGLTQGELWSVYSATGMLIYRSIAESDEAYLSLPAQGVLIIRSGERTVKVAYYGQ